jgi:hypothetical protein
MDDALRAVFPDATMQDRARFGGVVAESLIHHETKPSELLDGSKETDDRSCSAALPDEGAGSGA